MTDRETTQQIRRRWGLVVAVAMMLIALIPQIHFVLNRGHEWNKANAITHPDEVAYSAYLASLIRGNSRRNDPFTGRSDLRRPKVAESLFSIQFVPAYAVAGPARILGLSASTVFVILPAVCALIASLALFWFFSLLMKDERLSAAGAAIVFGFGTATAGQGIVRHVPNLNYLIPLWISNRVSPTALYGLPFLRLYQPAVAFPLFLLVCGLVWLALTRANQRSAIAAAIGAGAVFALLVFSYFYLWTSAAAWLVCLCVIWLVARGGERKRTVAVFAVIAVFAIAASFPYFSMLSHRAATVDAAQALMFTRRPDLFRFPEIVAALVIVSIVVGARRNLLSGRDPVGLIALSFALTVFAVFNQQIISGRSLQPIHYQWFVANYCALIAIVLTLISWQRDSAKMKLSQRLIAVISIAAVLWGGGEMWLAASVAWNYNRAVDEARPTVNRLAQVGSPDQVVLVEDLALADRLPTDAPQPVLWAPRMLVFPGVTETENRERFWRQLYYLGYDEKKFWAEVDRGGWNFLTGMFPYQRLSPAVSGRNEPLTPAELRTQLNAYLDYTRSFNRDRAASPALSYLIIHAQDAPDFANLDRWYQRDAGERVGDFILYRLKFRE